MKLTIGQNWKEDAKRMEADGVPKTKGLMARPDEGIFPRGGRFPSSRDWSMPEVKCSRRTCVANYGGVCVMPSCIEIGSKGCKGYKRRPKGEKK